MGGTCSDSASNTQIAIAVLTIPQTMNANNLTGKITYNYHYHSIACPHNTLTWVDVVWDGKTSHTMQYYRCSSGHQYAVSTWTSGNADKSMNGVTCPQCGYKCGYTDGQIINATITY